MRVNLLIRFIRIQAEEVQEGFRPPCLHHLSDAFLHGGSERFTVIIARCADNFVQWNAVTNRGRSPFGIAGYLTLAEN